jgi:hypothetical protein
MRPLNRERFIVLISEHGRPSEVDLVRRYIEIQTTAKSR